MELSAEQKEGLGIALNEAALLGLEVKPQERIAATTFRVLSLPEEGPPPEDPRVQFLFTPVGRVAASLRLGHWDDPTAEVVPFAIEELLEIVQSFDGLPIYGWEFFDTDADDFPRWSDRLSLDWQSGSDGLSHSITLFQEGVGRYLDVCVWFDDFVIHDPNKNVISLADFIAGGERWWRGFSEGDKRTAGHGIFPLGG